MAIKPVNNLNFSAIANKAKTVNAAAENAERLSQNVSQEALLTLPVESIDINPQVRTVFVEESIEELAASIKERGQISPITVRKNGTRYTLITGERRLRAVKKLGQPTIKAIVQNNVQSDADVTVSQLIENLQREDMGPLEIGVAYSKLMKSENWSAEEAARQTGKSTRYVYRMISVADLPERAQQWIEEEILTDTVAIERLSKFYKASLRPEEITEKLEHFVERGQNITRAVVEGLAVPAKSRKPLKAVPLKDVPLTVTNASDLRREKGYEDYEFPGMNFQILCEVTLPGVNKGKPVKGAQVVPNIVPKDRTKAVVEHEGRIYVVPWNNVRIYETIILDKKSGKKA